MLRKRWVAGLVASIVLVATFAVADAGTKVYLYDPSVVDDIDIAAYLADGTVRQVGGKAFDKYVQKGPAPGDYAGIEIAENSFEHLGASNVEIDGVWFLNHANFYVPNRRALVQWVVRIPNASARLASELSEDLTISMWVDWNQDLAWKPSERMTNFSFNLANRLPTVDDEIVVTYLTSFIVPDVTAVMASNAKYGNSGKDIRNMWVRALVAYDDHDASPDGGQLFGEYEDYRISYYIESRTASDGGSR